MGENLGIEVTADRERKGILPITLREMIIGECKQSRFPCNARRDFPFEFRFQIGTETVLSVMSSLDAKLSRINLNDVTANLQIVR